MLSARKSITVRNDSDDGETVYHIVSEPPLVDGNPPISVVLLQLRPIPRGGQCIVNFESGFYAFFGHTVGPLNERSRITLKSFFPVRVGSIANDGDQFFLSKSLKFAQMTEAAAPKSTFQILTDASVPTRNNNYNYVIGIARRGWISMEMPAPLAVAAVKIQPETVYTITPRSAIRIQTLSHDNTYTHSAKVEFGDSVEKVVVTDRGGGQLFADYGDGPVAAKEVANSAPSIMPNPWQNLSSYPDTMSPNTIAGALSQMRIQENSSNSMRSGIAPRKAPEPPAESLTPTPFPLPFSTMKSALFASTPADEDSGKGVKSIGGEPKEVGAADSDNWVAKFQSLVAHYRPGAIPEEHRLRVAILDSGIDLTHKDFKDDRRIKQTKSFIKNVDVHDTDGHGTHMAGIVLSLTQNVDLYVGKVTDSTETVGNYTSEIAEALRWAREDKDWKVHIISLSFGLDKRYTGIHTQINLCNGQNIIIFAAASNDGGNAPRAYPASYDPPVLGIHAATAEGNLWHKSPSAEPHTDNFLTVGQAVESAWPGGGKKYQSGTSVATPVAVAIAALMLGYIQRYIRTPAEGWSTSPRSPDGIRKIFRLLESNVRRNERYQWVDPVFFFEKFTWQPNKINEDIIAELANLGR